MLDNNKYAAAQALNVFQRHGNDCASEDAPFKRALAIAGYVGDDLPEKPKDITPALEPAMGYVIAHGWKVFPADVARKKSYLSEKYAPGGMAWGMTDDPVQLERNFMNRKWRDVCGVGIPTGAVNGIFDIEADTKAGHDVDGLASLQNLEIEHGTLPETLMAESPSASPHRIYQHPGHGIKIKSRNSMIAPGVDIKGDGGMFVAPPSERKDGVYRWLKIRPIAEAPQWLIDLVTNDNIEKPKAVSNDKNAFQQYGDDHSPRGREQAYAAKALSNVAEELSNTPQGERNQKLNKCAFRMGRMIARDWISQVDVEDELEQAAEACGLYEGISATIASGIKGGLKKPHEDLKQNELPKLETGKKQPWIVELGEKIWGPATVSGKEYRFGPDQLKVIDPGKGMWFDFMINRGGGLRDLMKMVEKANRSKSNADDIEVICAADVVMRPLDYLWPGHLLRGAQELLSGLPDVGKSQVQIGFIACATARIPWPDGVPAIEPVNVIMLTAEDTLDQAVVPRLRAAGADLTRVKIVECIKTDDINPDRQFLLSEDLERLERLVNKIGNVGLVCIDPITAYMGNVDSHSVTEVRSQLGPLKDFAERMNIAVSTITHPAKSAGSKALDQFIGSQAFIASCRVGHLCIEEVEVDDDGGRTPTGRHLFTNVRNSNEEKRPSLAYRKEAVTLGFGVTAPRVAWDGEVDITADAAVTASLGKKPDVQKKVQAFLCEVLKSGKPMLQQDIEELGKQEGFTPKQLRTAKGKLNVRSSKEAGKMDGLWLWTLIQD